MLIGMNYRELLKYLAIFMLLFPSISYYASIDEIHLISAKDANILMHEDVNTLIIDLRKTDA